MCSIEDTQTVENVFCISFKNCAQRPRLAAVLAIYFRLPIAEAPVNDFMLKLIINAQ